MHLAAKAKRSILVRHGPPSAQTGVISSEQVLIGNTLYGAIRCTVENLLHPRTRVAGEARLAADRRWLPPRRTGDLEGLHLRCATIVWHLRLDTAAALRFA